MFCSSKETHYSQTQNTLHMTTQHNEILEKLIATMNAINNSKKSTFNLFNVEKALEERAEAEAKAKEKQALELAWNELAMVEIKRIHELLKADMPKVKMELNPNGYPTLTMLGGNGISHHECSVNIRVVILRDSWEAPIALAYESYDALYGHKYKSIEELVQNPRFFNAVKTKVLYGNNV